MDPQVGQMTSFKFVNCLGKQPTHNECKHFKSFARLLVPLQDTQREKGAMFTSLSCAFHDQESWRVVERSGGKNCLHLNLCAGC